MKKINKAPFVSFVFLFSNSATGRDRPHTKSSKHLKNLIFIEIGGQFGGDYEKLTKHIFFVVFLCSKTATGRDRAHKKSPKHRKHLMILQFLCKKIILTIIETNAKSTITFRQILF